MNPVIKVENISKRYDLRQQAGDKEEFLVKSLFKSGRGKEVKDFWALKDINFFVEKGERLGIIGRNGAGKSTLLKILSRIVAPTTGRIEYEGRIASLLEVGTGFHPELTGRENVFLNGSILGMSKGEIKKKFDEIVDFAEVEKFLDTPVKRYSSGMYVRLAFAVAAHLDTEILIVDEVLAVGDSSFQDKCIGKINESQSEGKTVLFVSHNIGQISALCTRGIYLENGKVTYHGSVSDAVNLYLSKNRSEDAVLVNFEDKDSDYVIAGIRLSDSGGQAVNKFKHDESYSIHLLVKCRKKIADATIGVQLNDSRGKRIVSMVLPVADKIASGETKEFTAKLPGDYLVPNDYLISAAVHIPNVQVFDEQQNCIAFKIIDNGSVFYKYSGELGYIFPKNEWLY